MESWNALYLRVDDQERVVSELKRLMASNGYEYSAEWSALPLRTVPISFYFWVSPAIDGWIALVRRFPPLVATTKEIAAGLNCLVFDCWIGDHNWGYLLCQGNAVIDRFDSNPRQTVLYRFIFSELWEPGSAYAPFEASTIPSREAYKAFEGHPDRLSVLPIKPETMPEQLREIMDSRSPRQWEILRRFAEHINLPYFSFPTVPTEEALSLGRRYLAHPDPRDLRGKHQAESVEHIESFIPLAFRPLPVDQYRGLAQLVPTGAREYWIREAIKMYESLLNIFQWAGTPNTAEQQEIEAELSRLRALRP